MVYFEEWPVDNFTSVENIILTKQLIIHEKYGLEPLRWLFYSQRFRQKSSLTHQNERETHGKLRYMALDNSHSVIGHCSGFDLGGLQGFEISSGGNTK